VENYIGLIRRLCFHYDDIRRVQRVVARAELVHRLMDELNIPVIHGGRDNAGGCRFTQQKGESTFKYPFGVEKFVTTLCEHAGACIDAAEDDPYPRRPDKAAYLLECMDTLLHLNCGHPNPKRLGLNPSGRLKNPATHPGILARNAQYSRSWNTSTSK
jgi:hypothetical protein